jgi:Phospholipid N-methyltransferase
MNLVNMKQDTHQEKEMLASALTLMRAKANFVQQFIRNPRKMGSITPSSAALCRTMCDAANWDHSLRIAELGAGDGVLTRHILDRMSPQAQLDVFEISPDLVKSLRAWSDPRMQVRACSAEYLSGEYDVIFSGLPLLSLPPETREAILSAVHDVLGPRGVFIQFQYTSLTQPTLSRYFTWQRQRVLKNMPPAWVYRCTRHYAP